MLNKIKKILKNPYSAVGILKNKLLKNELFFNLLYVFYKEYILEYKNINIKFLTTDKHSKHWFFPRYDNGGMHEPVITKMLIDSLSEDKVFVDVGAHLGYFTCIASSICTKGKVYGFEVDKNAFKLLEKNIKHNELSNAEIFNYGVSDKSGFVNIPRVSSPSPGLAIDNNKNNKNNLSVKAVSLDDFFKEKKNKPNIIKIDVEGSELLVLKGMRSLLMEEDLILFLELHGNKLGAFKTNSGEIISFLNEFDYDVYEVMNHRSKNINEKRRLKKIEIHNDIQYNTMCYVTKKI